MAAQRVKHLSQRELKKLDERLRAAEMKERAKNPKRPAFIFLDPRRINVKIIGSVDRF